MSSKDPVRPPDNYSVCLVNHIEALKHLDPKGALSGLNMADHEELAIRAALDVWGLSLGPPQAGSAALAGAEVAEEE